MSTVLELKEINKSFPGVQALSNMNFSLEKGEVHAILGENGAGKSTLIKVISGVHKPDSGVILIDGKQVVFHNPIGAIEAGISVVYQEISTFPDLSVMENLFVGQYPVKGFANSVDFIKMREKAEIIFKRLGISFDINRKASELGIAEKQMLEIAKALMGESRILIFDEPTASLSLKEVETLFEIIKTLKVNGVSIIYISHRLEEIFTVADRVTVIRDGQFIKTADIDKVETNQLVQWMVGRKITNFFPKDVGNIGKTILRVQNIKDGVMVHGVSFELRRGEVLGFSGLAGSGRTETVTALVGLTPKTAGTIELDSKPVNITNYHEALKCGIIYISEDRQRDGLTLPMSVKNNITLAGLHQFCRNGVLNKKLEEDTAINYIKKFEINTPSPNFVVGNLSGGNQQKVSVSKGLAAYDPKVLILDEPTRGVDVGAKVEIHRLINELAQSGMAIIMISSELPEILGMSDRVLVLRKGKDVGIILKKDISQELILSLALTGKMNQEISQ